MKRYTMLKTVQGSRDGLAVETFAQGETHELSPELAEQFYHQGAVEEVAGGKNPADARATKVTGPDEAKVIAPAESKEGEAGVPLATQHVEELVAVARDAHGLDVDSTMDEATLRAMIAEAEAAETETETEAEAEAAGAEPETDPDATEADDAAKTGKAAKGRRKK